MRKPGAAPDYIVGSAHAVTDVGEIIVGSGSGTQLGAYTYAAGHVILVIRHQYLVHDLVGCPASANTACPENTPACKASAAREAVFQALITGQPSAAVRSR